MGAVLSFFIPGLGQLIQGRLFTALLCFIVTGIGYVCFILPGLIIHLCVIVDAYKYEQRNQVKAFAKAFKNNQR